MCDWNIVQTTSEPLVFHYTNHTNTTSNYITQTMQTMQTTKKPLGKALWTECGGKKNYLYNVDAGVKFVMTFKKNIFDDDNILLLLLKVVSFILY